METYTSAVPRIEFGSFTVIFADYYSSFQMFHNSIVTTQGVPYDYYSIMHYRAISSSKNGVLTILPLRNILSDEVGGKHLPTEYDYLHLNLRYCEGKEVTEVPYVCVYACMHMYICTYIYTYILVILIQTVQLPQLLLY